MHITDWGLGLTGWGWAAVEVRGAIYTAVEEKKQSEAVHWAKKSMKRSGWECAHCLIWFGIPNGLKQPIEFLCLNQIPAKETFYDALIGSLGFLERGTLTASYVFSITGITCVLLCFGFCFVFHIGLPWQFPPFRFILEVPSRANEVYEICCWHSRRDA